MISSLLNVKFFVPQTRSQVIERPYLVERFIAGLNCPLTLISAPAGFGKSTLVSDWINTQRQKGNARFDVVAWLSLDTSENDPARFWLYFLAALQDGFKSKEVSGLSPFEQLLEVLQSDMAPLLQPVINGLINSITLRPESFIVILDDYQFIQSTQVHEQVSYLLDHLPLNLRLVITTRTDPPLPLARLRARGQLSEFRSADLRFKKAEIAKFMNTMLGIEISYEDMLALENSTEGWIAGLQMAVLAMQAQFSEKDPKDKNNLRESVHDFVSVFSGKHIYILDYLTDEVFNRQSEDVQDFLLKTSVLGRMNASLCDEVIGAGDTEDRLHKRNSKNILEYLEKSNLFLIPLDSQRDWFRYHHLFTDLLQVRLDQTWATLKPELQKRASNWYKRNGNIEEALNYALAAEDWDQSANLMESCFQSLLECGQLHKILEWLNRLPANILVTRPRLCIQQAWVSALAQRAKDFISSLEISGRLIEGMASGAPGESCSIDELKTSHTLLSAYRQIMAGNPQKALEILEELSKDFPSAHPWEENWLYWMKGYAFRSIGKLDQASDSFSEALRICQEHDNLWNDMICYTDLAMVLQLRGQLKQARDLFLKALELGRVRNVPNHGYLSRVERGLGDLLLDLNKLEEAGLHAEIALERSQWWPSSNHLAASLALIGKIRLAKGDLNGASMVIKQADLERQKFPLLPINDSILDYAQVKLWLAQKNLDTARQWAIKCMEGMSNSLPQGEIIGESQELKLIALARVWMAEKKFEQVLDLLRSLAESALQSQRTQSLIEIDVLNAVALQQAAILRGGKARQSDSSALFALEKSLELAEPGGYIRVFLDEGSLLYDLLITLRSKHDLNQDAAYDKEYLNPLLEVFIGTVPSQNKKPVQDLSEALTGRELEVLKLMASGLSNREMAEKLSLSEGTIKSHVHNLIAKLDAQSRTHALARAKDLKII